MQLLSLDDSSKPFSLVPNPWLLPQVWAQDWSQHTLTALAVNIFIVRVVLHDWEHQGIDLWSSQANLTEVEYDAIFNSHVKNSMGRHSSLEGDTLFIVLPGMFMYHPLSTFLYWIWSSWYCSKWLLKLFAIMQKFSSFCINYWGRITLTWHWSQSSCAVSTHKIFSYP